MLMVVPFFEVSEQGPLNPMTNSFYILDSTFHHTFQIMTNKTVVKIIVLAILVIRARYFARTFVYKCQVIYCSSPLYTLLNAYLGRF